MNTIKKFIKVILPKKVEIWIVFYLSYRYDRIKYIRGSNTGLKNKTEEQILGLLTYYYHVIEKGLTMPTPRLGFGKERIELIIDLCSKYLDADFPVCNPRFIHAIGVLNEYILFHKNRNFELSENLIKKINDISKKVSIYETTKQMDVTNEEFFKDVESSFLHFSRSRHTVRDYSDKEIPITILHECINIAQTSPSACNRQPNRVYIVKDKQKIESILQLQNGNRGFGYLANNILIITSDLAVFRDTAERNDAFLNAGMYAMTLMNALHFYKIGSCALNWSVSPQKDILLHKEIGISRNERICLIISCGYPPQNFKVALSPKRDWSEITKDIL